MTLQAFHETYHFQETGPIMMTRMLYPDQLRITSMDETVEY